MKDRVEQLLEILFDKTAREDEKHDAVMYLYDYDDPRIVNAFLKIGQDENTPIILLDAVGEGIGELWSRNNIFDPLKLKDLTGTARDAVVSIIELKNPDLLKKKF